ncbi:MAG: zf-HC2 domain-containing protein [Actinomycetota bacterium]
MTSQYSCEEVRRLAPELALGISSGDERARALAHLAGCPDCRHFVAELSGVADEILLVAPAEEPPGGFEGRVLERLREERSPRRRSPIILGAAAALVAAAVAVGGVLFATRDDRRLAAHLKRDLAEANGDYFGVVSLRDPDGIKDGVVFAYEGSPPWLFLDVDDDMAPGSYAAEIVMDDGSTRALGTPFELTADKAWWASALPVSWRDVSRLRIKDEAGAQVLSARFGR